MLSHNTECCTPRLQSPCAAWFDRNAVHLDCAVAVVHDGGVIRNSYVSGRVDGDGQAGREHHAERRRRRFRGESGGAGQQHGNEQKQDVPRFRFRHGYHPARSMKMTCAASSPATSPESLTFAA